MNNVETLQNKVSGILLKMNISKAIIIDDKVGQNEKVEASEIVVKVLEGGYDSPDFDIRNEMKNLGLDIEEQKEKALHGENDEIIIEICKKAFPEIEGLLHSEINELILVVKEIFGENNVRTFTNTAEVQEQGLSGDTVLFLDYKLDGKSPHLSQDLVKILSEKENQTEPKCIIFISKDPYFFIDQNNFTMSNPIEKSKYFNEIKKQLAETNYRNTLYDFISKQSLTSSIEIYEAIIEAFENLNGGQVFYELLKVIDDVLVKSSQKVLNKFYLLNARSLQELLESKIENEGLAKTTFLMEWIARNIAKSVISNTTIIKTINEKLENIGESQLLINEFHEDLALRDIVRSEMWDSSINERYEPIDFGDIFKIKCNGIDRRAILMTQSCTLAVRKDGNRASKVGILILEIESKNNRVSNTDNDSPRHITINYYDNEKITFSLDDTITFSLEILDLTTLNYDGSATISIQVDNNELELPKEAFWTDGYRNKMIQLLNRLIQTAESRKFGAEHGFMPIEQSWLEYEIKNKSKIRNYQFPIKRLVRLDYQYAMHIFQKAQSWWGRIGLPVQLNFTDEYKSRQSSIIINNLSKQITLYEKHGNGGNDLIDCCIDMQELEKLIQEIYDGDFAHFQKEINELINDNRNIRYNCTSGKRLLSLKASKAAKEYFARNGVYFELAEDCLNVIAKLPYFLKCYFNENDITAKISGVKFTSSGELKCDIPFDVIEKCGFLEKHPQLIIGEQDQKVLKFAESKLKEYIEIQIDRSELIIKEINPMREVAATQITY